MIHTVDLNCINGDTATIKGKENFSLMVFYSNDILHYTYICLN